MVQSAERAKEWREENKHYLREYHRRWRAKNKKHCREWYERWYLENGDRQRKANLDYHRANRDARLACQRLYYEENKNGRIAIWRRKNHKRILAWCCKYRRDNRVLVRVKYREWARLNRDKRSLNERKRRAHKVINGGSHDWHDVLALFKKQNGCCAGCGKSIKKKFQIDHKRPLSRGGSNGPRNLQLLCQLCNGRKHAKTMREWKRRLKSDWEMKF